MDEPTRIWHEAPSDENGYALWAASNPEVRIVVAIGHVAAVGDVFRTYTPVTQRLIDDPDFDWREYARQEWLRLLDAELKSRGVKETKE